MKKPLLPRRDFVGGLAGALLAGAAGGCQNRSPAAAGNEPPDCFFASNDNSGRLAVTMWEFSWLVRQQGVEREYADWDIVLDELAERGYNCIRLDAFPHLIAADQDGKVRETFTVLPQDDLFMWGNHEPVRVNPQEGLTAFLSKMKDRGLRAGLSAWYNDDSTHRRQMVDTPADYARIWIETLDFLADKNLLDVIEWVDLCNEFPNPMWSAGAYSQVFGEDDLAGALGWSDLQKQAIQLYLDEATGGVRDKYPDLKYTWSVAAAYSGESFRSLDTASLDIVEPHIWLTGNVEFMLRSGQGNLLRFLPGSLEAHLEKGPELYYEEREKWLAWLNDEMEVWRAWSAARNLPLYTTEAWGPINYDDSDTVEGTKEWDWVKDVCAQGVQMAVDKGWKGICTSNFAQPHFEGMWRDPCWHQKMNAMIRG